MNFCFTFDNSFILILDCPIQNYSGKNLSKQVQSLMEYAGNLVNHVNAFFVRELGKYLILKFSLFVMSPSLVKYRAICSTVDSLMSPTNLVNLETF